MELKDRLRELRGNITQTQFAKNIGVTAGNYSKWERGETIPDYKTLIRIANYHNVSLDYLTGRTNYKDTDYKNTSIDTGLTENTIKYIRSMSPEVRDVLEPITKELVADEDTSKQKVKLLHILTEISAEDIVLLCMIAKRFPKRRNTNE